MFINYFLILCYLYFFSANLVTENDPKKKCALFKALLLRMPPVNLAVVRYLLMFLAKVAQKSDKNQMTPNNLGIVFGPTLLRCRDSSMEVVMTSNQTSVQVISFMIENSKAILV
jgi:uncharacterized membrane protein